MTDVAGAIGLLSVNPGLALRLMAGGRRILRASANVPWRDRWPWLPGARCGFYLSVVRAGSVCAGETGTLVPGRRSLKMPDAFASKRARHLR